MDQTGRSSAFAPRICRGRGGYLHDRAEARAGRAVRAAERSHFARQHRAGQAGTGRHHGTAGASRRAGGGGVRLQPLLQRLRGVWRQRPAEDGAAPAGRGLRILGRGSGIARLGANDRGVPHQPGHGWTRPAKRLIEAYYGARNGSASGAYKGCAAYIDYRELLEKEKDVDAVYVATPDHWHAPISLAAMKRHKHVLCQKPMTHTIGDARRMAATAREMQVATSLPVNNPSSDATKLIAEWIADGAIGPGARSAQLVQPALLAAGHRTAHGGAAGSRRPRLEYVAGPRARASVQSRLSAVCLARLVRFRLRIVWRYGLLQFRGRVRRFWD